MPAQIRVGAVSYLNTKPLVYRLETIAPFIQLTYDLPSRLADALARADLDVALIPSLEYFQVPDYRLVSDACIACRGPVLSVKLLSRTPLDEIRTLALDEGSRTSVGLVQILLRQRFGLSPRLEPLSLGADPGDSTADAILLIGDRAMCPPAGEFVAEWDLGDEWCRWSGWPFVFAMWTARPGVEVVDLAGALTQARDAGVTDLERIAAAEAAAVGLSPAACLSYLRDNLYFYLGPRERRGLQLFRRHAIELGLAPPEKEHEARRVESPLPPAQRLCVELGGEG